MSQTRGSLFELFQISSRFTVGENDIDGYDTFFIVGGEILAFSFDDLLSSPLSS